MRSPTQRFLLTLVGHIAACFLAATAIKLLAPWGELEWEQAIIFSVALGGTTAITTPGWEIPDLTRRISERLPAGATVELVLPVRLVPKNRPPWLMPNSCALILTGTQIVAYSQHRVTGRPVTELWHADRLEPELSIHLSNEQKALHISVGKHRYDFYVPTRRRKEAARFAAKATA